MRTHTPRWSPDGTKLSFVGGHPRNWYIPSEVYVADRATETVQSVSGSLDRTVSFGGAPQWIDEQTLIGLFGDEGNTRPYRLDATTDGPELVFQAQGDGRAVDLLEVGNDTVGMRISDPSEGIDVYSLPISALDRTDEDNLVKVTAVNEELLSDVATPECVRLTWENSDGIEIEGYAYLPPDFDSENPDARPTIASIHGGPMSYDSPSFSFDFLYWINQGYIVYRTNYRGSTSYGRKFSERLRGTRGDLEVDDVVSGADYLIDKEWADPNQLFVTGFSYGGITTAAIVTSTDKFSAAAAEHGIYDFYSTFGTDDNHLWHEDEFGLPWENIETYREISSLTDVGNVDTPLLVTAGDRDWRCPPTQAEQLYV
ncbi:MAG: prolyl oligopeptidase family serine peptidase, partial [Halobacteriaceae archaeon]